MEETSVKFRVTVTGCEKNSKTTAGSDVGEGARVSKILWRKEEVDSLLETAEGKVVA